MLTIKQRLRLWWFKVNNRKYQVGILGSIFDNYSNDPELFYELNKYISFGLYELKIFSESKLYMYVSNYKHYPILQNSIKRIIRENIEYYHPDKHSLQNYVNVTILYDCDELFTFIIDIIKEFYINYIEIFNELALDPYHGLMIDLEPIYKYLVKHGADYRLIPEYSIRVKIEQEYLVSNLCLLNKILKNAPSELMDVNKMTNNIGQFMREKSMFDCPENGSYGFAVGKFDLTHFGSFPIAPDVANDMANQILTIRNMRIDSVWE